MIFDYDFLYFPSFMHCIAIRYVQHCQTMWEHGVCELAHSIEVKLYKFQCFTMFVNPSDNENHSDSIYIDIYI